LGSALEIALDVNRTKSKALADFDGAELASAHELVDRPPADVPFRCELVHRSECRLEWRSNLGLMGAHGRRLAPSSLPVGKSDTDLQQWVLSDAGLRARDLRVIRSLAS